MRAMGRVLVTALAGVLLAGCGSSGGGASAGSGPSAGSSVASGPLPTFATYQALEAAIAPGCDWQVSPPSGSPGEDEPYGLFCPELGVRAVWTRLDLVGKPLTMEDATAMADSDREFRCNVMVGFCQMMAIGGNWMAWATDPDRTSDIAISTGAFLLPEPTDRPHPSP